MEAKSNIIHLNRRRNEEIEYLMQVLEDIKADRPVAPVHIHELGVSPGDIHAPLCLGLSIRSATLYGYLNQGRMFFLIESERIIFGIEAAADENPLVTDPAGFDTWLHTVVLPSLPFPDFTLSDENYNEETRMVGICAERRVKGASDILTTMDAVCEGTEDLAYPAATPPPPDWRSD